MPTMVHGVSCPLVPLLTGRGVCCLGAWSCRPLHRCLSCTGWRSCSSGGAVAMLIMPPLGHGSMVVRPPWGIWSRVHDASPSRSSDWEQDHVVAETGGHELMAPEPDHRGVWDWWDVSGHPKKDGKSIVTRRAPTWCANCRCFDPGGNTSEWICVRAPFSEWLCKNDTRIYPGSGKGRPNVQRGESVYYLASKCLYRGKYKWM